MDEIGKATKRIRAATGAVAGAANRQVQVRKARADGWTVARRNAFLDHLAMTCNVQDSALAVGMASEGAHRLRRRDAAFAEAWRAALEEGYEHIEGQLLARAIGQQADPERRGDPSARPVDTETGFRLLAQRNRLGGSPRRGGPARVKRVPIEQLTASLKRKLDALAKRLGGE